jgi:ABC-type sulfate transport system permease component
MASHEKTINGKRLMRWVVIFFVALPAAIRGVALFFLLALHRCAQLKERRPPLRRMSISLPSANR